MESHHFCSICFYDISNEIACTSCTSCKHKFCNICIQKWVCNAKYPTCPMCRSYFDTRLFKDMHFVGLDSYVDFIKMFLRKINRVRRVYDQNPSFEKPYFHFIKLLVYSVFNARGAFLIRDEEFKEMFFNRLVGMQQETESKEMKSFLVHALDEATRLL